MDAATATFRLAVPGPCCGMYTSASHTASCAADSPEPCAGAALSACYDTPLGDAGWQRCGAPATLPRAASCATALSLTARRRKHIARSRLTQTTL